jgi:two-component system phosphate regulon sensor histidine kinase PhoR
MNKRFFIYLMALMGLSILGIIAVQLIWINNAIQVKNELFDRSVTEALNNTVRRIEVHRDVEVLTGIPRPGRFYRQPNAHPAAPVPPRAVRIIRNTQSSKGQQFEFETLENDSNIQVFQFSAPGDTLIETSSFSFTDGDTIYTTTTDLVSTAQTQLDSIETMANKYRELDPRLQKRLELRSENLKRFGSRFMQEMAALDVDQIPLAEVSSLLKKELENQNIKLDFDAAILEHDTIQSMTEQADSLKLVQTRYQTNLFPRAIFDRDTKLSVFFPKQERYIYRSVSWLLVASLFFSIFILLTFTLSIFFMLRQKKISEMKSDFINNMTHEFKTPIATISVAADSIRNEKVISQPEKITYFIDMIKKENARMNRQVEDILTIARLDKKDFEFKWEPINIHQLIEGTIEGIILQVEKRGGKIETDFRAANPTVTTDRIHGANIIYNLLDNANKYSSDRPEIKVETWNHAKGVLIRVSDRGIGMSKSVQARIFERFYRQTSGNIHNVKGFGLGLSYVKAVVEANQGSISVQSEPGKGSQLEVFLPFTREN